MFLDISKAFDKVWHKRLIFELKTYDVEGKLIMLLKNYLQYNASLVITGAFKDTSRERLYQEL